MQTFTCHVTRSDEIVRRVEVTSVDRLAAMREALAGRPGRVSCHPTDNTGVVLAALAVRMSSFPLIGGVAP
jgi:hypothetical protein